MITTHTTVVFECDGCGYEIKVTPDESGLVWPDLWTRTYERQDLCPKCTAWRVIDDKRTVRGPALTQRND